MTSATASAYWSASAGGSLYVTRYLSCIDEPAKRARCVGPIRAKQQILAALHVGELVPGTNHDAEVDPARDAALDAMYFNITDAIPKLRKLMDLQLLPRDRDNHVLFEKQGLRVEAAHALAHLGDTQSAQKIADLVVELETDGYGTLWSDALASLAVIDPARASRYAIDFVGRTKEWKMSMPGGSSKLGALDYILTPDAVPMLERAAKDTTYDHAECLLKAAIVRLDPKMRAEVRKDFVGHYGGTWLAGCANDVMPNLGVEPEDAPALVRHLGRDDNGMDYGMANISYRRILDLELALGSDARSNKAREVLRKGLVERNHWPHVADPSHRNFSLHFVAFHRAALAGLGDADARRGLYELVDSSDREGNAWIAAYWALRLKLPNAADHAAALVKRDLTFTNDGRGDVYRDIRTKLLDVFADSGDPRWTAQLLDPDRDAAERALYRFSRAPTPKACDVVTEAARDATPEGVEHGLLALTVLGQQCLPQIERLFLDRVDPEIRGAALEFLAVLESPKICEHIARARAEKVWEPAIERAELLVTHACKPVTITPRKYDQPLPPRVHRQGM